VHRALLGVCLLLVNGVVEAREPEQAHVRAESVEMRQLIADAAERSATVRALIDALDGSDVVVYVRPRLFRSVTLDARTGFLAGGSRRLLVIELPCPQTRDTQIALLAHELQHAVEIAQAAWVVDTATLARYYGEIGIRLGMLEGGTTFETEAACRVGARVRSELGGRGITRDSLPAVSTGRSIQRRRDRTPASGAVADPTAEDGSRARGSATSRRR